VRILLAEDERKLTSAIEAYLEQVKYDVDYVSDGSSALSTLESGMYDMAILDIMIPEMDGFPVIRTARAAGIKIPFLVLSAKSEVDDTNTGLNCGQMII
jgi:two component transcriptional regulator, winged helix family